MASHPHRRTARVTGRWTAVALAIAVHALFIGVLVFSLRWQNAKPEAVTAELYAPPRTPVRETPPAPELKPVPPVEPKPEPKPVPVPAPVPKPEPRVERPDPREAEIALKARKEDERRRIDREKQEIAKKEQAKREADKKELDKRERERVEADAKKQEERRLADARDRQAKESEALRAQAERERQVSVEAQLRAQAQAEARARAGAETSRAEADYIQSIQRKVRGNVIVPPEVAGNPEAIFEVVQLPTGEIIEAALTKSSGVRAYDDAVQRAILKSSPLPLPKTPDLFQRALKLKFRPKEN
ncbi:MAG: cell envelope integrity protein TolA [Betaproteobacteria bacterium]